MSLVPNIYVAPKVGRSSLGLGLLYQLEKASSNTSKFLEWMETNKTDEEARKLLYVEFPKHYVWNKSTKKWTKRKQG